MSNEGRLVDTVTVEADGSFADALNEIATLLTQLRPNETGVVTVYGWTTTNPPQPVEQESPTDQT